ncbi:MAG: hypothetical protein ACN4GM_10010, partial [Gammaproteobacteria bacterium]
YTITPGYYYLPIQTRLTGMRSGKDAGSLLLAMDTWEHTMDKFYRIKISFREPNKLSDSLKSQLRRELAKDAVYLGIRFNSTTLNHSAAIHSLELVHQCMEFAKNTFKDYGEVTFTAKSYPCKGESMKSNIDTDSRMLIHHLKNSRFVYNGNINLANVANNSEQRSESRA